VSNDDKTFGKIGNQFGVSDKRHTEFLCVNERTEQLWSENGLLQPWYSMCDRTWRERERERKKMREKMNENLCKEAQGPCSVGGAGGYIAHEMDERKDGIRNVRQGAGDQDRISSTRATELGRLLGMRRRDR
jgi:hypothetical protein